MLDKAAAAGQRLDDVSYHRQREAQERAAAADTVDASARFIHLNLAERHAERARCVGGVAPPFVGRDTDATLSISTQSHEIGREPDTLAARTTTEAALRHRLQANTRDWSRTTCDAPREKKKLV